MSSQLDLIDYIAKHKARKNDPATSHKAAENASQFAHGHARAILDTFERERRPLAAQEIQFILGWPNHHAINRRFSELQRAGLIEPTEEMHTNRGGSKARRYQLVRSGT